MPTRSKVTSEPAQEPVTLAELKSSLKITDSSEDSYLTQLITDARELAEDYTGRKFITQTITTYTDSFGKWYHDPIWEGLVQMHQGELTTDKFQDLDYAPAQSITSMSTFSDDNTETTYSSANYYIDNFDEFKLPRVQLNNGASIPNGTRPANGIKIVWVAGYGDNPSNVPASIRRGILELASYMYEQGGGCSGSGCVEACSAKWLLRKYQIKTHGLLL